MIRAVLILGLIALAACSRPAPDPRSQITRAQLETVTTPLLLAELTGLGTAAGVTPVSANGDVTTWQTGDGVSLSFRSGVVVATRGLGQDVLSADVENTLAALRGAREGYYTRFHSFMDGEHQTGFRSFQCRVTARAAERITIFDHVHATTRVDETCLSPGVQVDNSYWLGGGIMWKSKQWVGPVTGYLLTERLVR
ncbi:YjbF family lipoprotein [Marinovum sp.]|uniref:YjbF family lipoprotein n=1 Tax=Marinovum sp. TaxID=2024839 RepID=UPI002B26884D|nr:YjbF family lipoprotein [Marinovum sp.]